MAKDVDMEKDAYKNAESVEGEIRIADDVVANIAGIAATEVEGVAATVGNITNELMSKVGMRTLSKGVTVEVVDSVVSVKMALIMDYGYNIPVTCKKVQERVKNAIESMTGLEVSDVSVRIAGIDTSKQV
ncbi:MAG: Asp23/Gls24 family envelope stress response protein [Lachnospiraceae bacterium]|nr:Asp23/Gls24 family envelope stress response protein [Lachnospiraceae bacterium]